VPIFLSIGYKVLERIENLCLTLAYKRDFNYLDLPTLIPTETLALGEDINPRFLDQFVFAKDRLKHFHLLSTPEPFLIYILKYGLESYRQLPMNIIFAQKFFRQLREVDGILKTGPVLRTRLFGTSVLKFVNIRHIL